ncbi:MAG: tetratricopeptide repeat protein [Clostridium sp.]|uniref:tetratricopeptide repeat protein n=1 Tax=Clostridium sp. TaxID=1506 RepID=UPI003D6CB624
MGIIDGLISVFTGVTGNGIFSYITKEDLEYKINNAYECAVRNFNEKYGDEYGDKNNSFLIRQENIDLIINSFNFQEENVSVESFNNSPYVSTKYASNEVILDFMFLLRKEMKSDFQLSKLLAEKEHICEQHQMNKHITHFNEQLSRMVELQTRSNNALINDSEINFNEIMNIYNEKNYTEQEFKLIKWLNINKGHKEGIILKAHIEYNRGHLELAKEIFSYIVEQYEEEFEFNNTIALIYEKLGEFNAAEKKYLLVLQKDPRNLNVLYNIGNLYTEEYENYEESLKYLFKASEVAPYDSEVLNNIGAIYKEKLHDYSKAKEYLELAMKYSKDNPVPFINMGELYLEVYREYDKAVMFFESALKVTIKDKGEIHNILGLIYGSVIFKDKDKSIMNFEKALKFSPLLKEARLNLNIINSNIGYFDMFKTLSFGKVVDLLDDKLNHY